MKTAFSWRKFLLNQKPVLGSFHTTRAGIWLQVNQGDEFNHERFRNITVPLCCKRRFWGKTQGMIGKPTHLVLDGSGFL